MTSTEIAEHIDVTMNSIYTSIRRLLKDVSVELHFRELTPEEKQERYGRYIGRKIKIYRLDE